MWFYSERILVAYQVSDAAAHNRPRGNLSDLYPRWLGARELLLYHHDPYSGEVTREIQEGYYGRALDPARPNDPKDQQGFAYPVYVVFLLAPTITIPFATLQAGFHWLLPVLIAITVLLWLRVLQWRAPPSVVLALILLTLGSFPAVQGIELQQLSIVVSAMTAGCAALLVRGHLAWAGVLLALATIKPQLVWLLAAWLVVWALSDWRKRQRFLWAFGFTLGLLFLEGELVLPGWIWRFREAAASYRNYTGGVSLLEMLTTTWVGRVLDVLIVLALARVCWRWRHEPANSRAFAFSLALVLAVTIAVIPMVAPYNQLLLLPAVILLARRGRQLWAQSRLTRVVAVISAIFLCWSWLASAIMCAASVIVPAAVLQKAWAVPLYSSLGVPICVLGLLALCVNQWPGGAGQRPEVEA
ncbi:MAG TPA: glycosyltransferase family 87 protein [Terriglobales bacterium]|nr:glycosyltransferase family 87 protein [Terriglobales bacterium]